MILLVDNYDSFSYNLYQLLGELQPRIKVIRNDQETPEEIRRDDPEAIILSPGPGRPEQAGYCMEIVRRLGDRIPILGVCLGHQAICAAYGGEIIYAGRLMHGKQSLAEVDTGSWIFRGLNKKIPVARYHSLAAREESLPPELQVTARSEDGEVMAVQHRSYPVCGLQFHPESILTPDGRQILKNFLEAV